MGTPRDEHRGGAFERLRLRRRGAAAGAGVGLAGAAGAVTTSLSVGVTTGGVIYSEINNTTVLTPLDRSTGSGGISMTGSGFGIRDVFTSAGGNDDAFDAFAGIGVRVDGAADSTPFQHPNDEVDLTTTADGTFVTTVDALDVDGIDVSLDYFMDGSSPTLRVLGTFTNTDGLPHMAEVGYGGEAGSDGNTQIEDTSNGDTTFDQATDRYVITSDGGANPDPVITLVRFGPGAQVPFSTPSMFGVMNPAGAFDEYVDVFKLNLDPGETQRLMFFVQLNPDADTAEAGAPAFADLDTLEAGGLLAGLNTATVDQIVNWARPAAPSVSEPATFALMSLGLVGAVLLKRFQGKRA